MATLQEQLDGLNQAIADGVRSVTVRGQTTIYNTTTSLIEARDDVQTRLNASLARQAGGRSKQTLLYHAGRGYDR